ncbi:MULTISPECIES: hypothetical protein [Acinetobacter]|uniref:hypothetical protein n=1 Tax=Acinetobacter TaxID=469 RepID=UPI0002AEBA37|nr:MULTISPECIES: hypothetical protein [Acinetobacter]ELW77045.1 hypothetical protein ACINWC743_A0641 [Acinetobacter sp. WC-743]MBJ8428120.1 hypothetical protein [Acinetobacter bereziniae]
MKKKDNQDDSAIAQSGWEMLDNYGDKIIEATVEGVASDLLSSIPLATIAMGVFKGYKKYKEKQNFIKFVSFIRSYRTNTDEEIKDYLKENPTSEVGEYTLSLLEELTSPRQTEMLGRATALLLNKVINEATFYEYSYIISKLNPHLFTLLEGLKSKYFKDENGRDDLRKKLELSNSRSGLYIRNPNQDLLSFSFLDAKEIEITTDMTSLPEQCYEVNTHFNKFYTKVVLGEQCTPPQRRE